MSAPTPRNTTHAATTKGLLHLAGPLVLSFWFRTLFQWVDTVFASTIEGLGDASIAAIGLMMPFEFLMIACWVGTSNALTSHLATAMGAKQGAKIKQLLGSAKRVIAGLGVFFMTLATGIWFLSDNVGLAPDVAGQFRIFGTVLLAGSSVTVFLSILPDSIVKAHHDTKTTMWAGMASTMLNLVLNALFLFVFDWGIFGIALATVLGRLGGLSYAMVKAAELERQRIRDHGNGEPGLLERPLQSLLILAMPAGLAFVLMALESFAFNGLLARSNNSADYLAAWSILDRTSRFLVMPVLALGVAMLPLVARLRGAGRFDQIQRELRLGILAASAFSLLFVAPVSIFAGPSIARALTDSPESARIASLGMYWLPLGILFGSPLLLLRPTFEGMQLARPGLALSALRSFVLVIPLGYIGFQTASQLNIEPIEGVMAGIALGSGLASFVAWTWMRRAYLSNTHDLAKP